MFQYKIWQSLTNAALHSFSDKIDQLAHIFQSDMREQQATNLQQLDQIADA